MKKIFTIILLSAIALTLSGCKPSTSEDDNVVYVTAYPMQYLVEQIAGDTVEVKRVPGSQVHSESIDWSGKEIIDMVKADLIFYIDAGFDSYIPDNNEDIFSDGDVELVNISETVTYNLICFTHTHNDDEDEHTDSALLCDDNMLNPDPHFWLDPVRMLKAAELVRDKLILSFPEFSVLYENRFTVLGAALEKLDEDFQAMADDAIKPIITTNMLFTYWHVRYEIEILSLSTNVHSNDTIPGDIIEFVNEAQYHFIHTILFEKNANSPAGEQVLEQLLLIDPEAHSMELHGLGNITTEEFEQGSTYMSIMYENLAVLIEATNLYNLCTIVFETY